MADPADVDADETAFRLRACRDEIRRRIQWWASALAYDSPVADTQAFGGGDYEVLEREVSFQGFFALHTLKVRNKLFRGGWSEPYEREVFHRTTAVVVLPYDPKLDQVVLLEQFRAGAVDTETNPWLLEAVAGIVEPGESWEMMAHREGMEEADCVFKTLIPVTHYLVQPWWHQ